MFMIRREKDGVNAKTEQKRNEMSKTSIKREEETK